MFPGIHSVLVALLSEKADVQYSAERISPDKIVAEVQALGFGAELISENEIYQEGQLDLSVSSSLWTHNLMSLSVSLCLFLSLPDIWHDLLFLCPPHREDTHADPGDRESRRHLGNRAGSRGL